MQILGENVRVNFSSMEKQQLLNSQDVITRLTAQLTNDILETTDVGVNATDVREGLNYLLGVAGDDNSLSIMPPNDAINISSEQLATINETIAILNTLLSQRYTDAGGWWYLNFDLELPHTVDGTIIPANETPELLRMYQYRQLDTENTENLPISDYKLRFTYVASEERYMLSAFLNYVQTESEGETIGTWEVSEETGAVEGFKFNTSTNEWDSVELANMPNIGGVTPVQALAHYLLIINENGFNPSYSYNWISENNELTDITQELYDYFVQVFNNYQSVDDTSVVDTYNVTITWEGMYEDQVNLSFSNEAMQIDVPLVRNSSLVGQETVELTININEDTSTERAYSVSFGDIETEDLYFKIGDGEETPVSELSITSALDGETIQIIDEASVEQTITIIKPSGLTTPEYITYSNSDGTINFNFVLLPDDNQGDEEEVLTVTQVIPRAEETYTVHGLSQTYPHLNCVTLTLPLNGNAETTNLLNSSIAASYSTSFHVYLIQTESLNGEPVIFTLNLNFDDGLELASYYIASEEDEIFISRPASGYITFNSYKQYIQYESGSQKIYQPFIEGRTIIASSGYQIYHMSNDTKVIDESIVIGGSSATYYIESLFSLGVSGETVIYDGNPHILEISIIDNREDKTNTPSFTIMWEDQSEPGQLNVGEISYTDPGNHELYIYLKQENEIGQLVTLLKENITFSIYQEYLTHIVTMTGLEVEDYFLLSKDYDGELLYPYLNIPIESLSALNVQYKISNEDEDEDEGWTSNRPSIYNQGEQEVEVKITLIDDNPPPGTTIIIKHENTQEVIDSGTEVGFTYKLRIISKALNHPTISLEDQVGTYERLIKATLPNGLAYNDPQVIYQYAITETNSQPSSYNNCVLNVLEGNYYLYTTDIDGSSHFVTVPETFNGYVWIKLTSPNNDYVFDSSEYSTQIVVNLPKIYVTADLTTASFNPTLWPHQTQEYELTYYEYEDGEYVEIALSDDLALNENEYNLIYFVDGTIALTPVALVPTDPNINTFSLNIGSRVIKQGYEYQVKPNTYPASIEITKHIIDANSELNFTTYSVYYGPSVEPYNPSAIFVDPVWSNYLSATVYYPIGDGTYTDNFANFIAGFPGFISSNSAIYTLRIELADSQERFQDATFEVSYQIDAVSFNLTVSQSFDWSTAHQQIVDNDIDKDTLFTFSNFNVNVSSEYIAGLMDLLAYTTVGQTALYTDSIPGAYPDSINVTFNGSSDINYINIYYPGSQINKIGLVINPINPNGALDPPVYTITHDVAILSGVLSEDVIHVEINEAYHFNNSLVGVVYDPVTLINETNQGASVSVTLSITNTYIAAYTTTIQVTVYPSDEGKVIYVIEDAEVISGQAAPPFTYEYNDNNTGIPEVAVTKTYSCGYDPTDTSPALSYPIEFTSETLAALDTAYDGNVRYYSGTLTVSDGEQE